MSFLYKSNIGATDGNLVSLTRGGPFGVDSPPKLTLVAQRTANFTQNVGRISIWDQFGERNVDSAALLNGNPNVNLLVLQYIPDASPVSINTGTVRGWLNPVLDGTEPTIETSFGAITNATEGLSAFDTMRIFSFSGNAEQRPVFDEVRVGSTFAEAVRQARIGDANADGLVDFPDLLVLAQNYGQLAANGWSSGDFDADGLVDFPDLLALAQNYGQSGVAFDNDWALAQSMVPEPTSLAVAGAVAAWSLGRRRRA
jgi:hypothetical protein